MNKAKAYAVPAADHPDLYGIVVLGLSRKVRGDVAHHQARWRRPVIRNIAEPLARGVTTGS